MLRALFIGFTLRKQVSKFSMSHFWKNIKIEKINQTDADSNRQDIVLLALHRFWF